MKKLLLIGFFGLSGFLLHAQAPAQINYQGVARNSVGSVIADQNISLRLTIRESTTAGTVLYQEIRNLRTNSFGLFTTAIGSMGASYTQGSFSTIKWADGLKFLQVEIDPTGGANFIHMGVSQLLSVPYALYAGAASPTGKAGGDLQGTYPNPVLANESVSYSKLADGAVGTAKVQNGAITAEKLAPGIIPTKITPTGNATGDLTGTYPNPAIAAAAITNTKLADASVNTQKLVDGSVTTNKLADGVITASKLAPGVLPASFPPSGPAGGDLTGTYPNPVIANNAIATNKIQDGAIITLKLADGSVLTAKIADAAITTAKLADASVTTAKLANGAVSDAKISSVAYTKITGAPTALAPTGAASGDLSGTYPAPSIAAAAVTTQKISDGAVTDAKIANGISYSKLSGTPTSMAPSGSAGGDLNGNYPNPVIKDNVITSAKIVDGTLTNADVNTNAAIAYGKLNLSNSISATDLTDGSVTSAKIKDDAVTTAKITTGAITDAQVSTTAAIAYSKLNLAGSIATTDLSNAAITTAKLADGAVTDAKIAPGISYSKLSGAPTSMAPSGTAGGDLSGSYPNPTIAVNAITTAKLNDGAVSSLKIQDGAIITLKLADGSVLTAKIADAAITTAKLADASVTTAKLADGAVSDAKISSVAYTKITGAPTALAPTGAASGDLSGTYPAPSIAAAAVTTQKISDGAVTDAKIANGISYSKLSGAPTSMTPSGSAGGDLAGTYPNPTIANNAVTTSKISATGATSGQVLTFNGTGVVWSTPSSGSASGNAGGDLNGAYPNPNIRPSAVSTGKIADGAVTAAKLSATGATSGQVLTYDGTALAWSTLASSAGTAGGDLTGTYPNPAIGSKVVTAAKIADATITNTQVSTTAAIAYSKLNLAGSIATTDLSNAAVTTAKLADGAVTDAKIASGISYSKLSGAPTSMAPSGTAGGDLSGSYPNPNVSKLQGVTVNTTAPTTGQVLKYDGTRWTPATDNTGTSFTLPYTQTLNSTNSLFSATNSGSGTAIDGSNSSNTANATAVLGRITSLAPGADAAAVKGINNGLNVNGTGVWGQHAGGGTGVYGSSQDGAGIMGTSINGSAGYFDISNANSSNAALHCATNGYGTGITAMSAYGYGAAGVAMDVNGAGVIGYHMAGGEGVFGYTMSDIASGVVGRNDGNYAGVKGINETGGGIGVLAEVHADGTALVANVDNVANGNPAVFKVNGTNVARIDKTGRGFFNGGTQMSGADVAEMFDITGNTTDYEPGDVLVISQTEDRKVQKSATPYSNLVAGIYATKPGVLLTEKNAEEDQLDDMVPMGVIGVIPTKVCLEGGAIKRGDMLVTSSIPGVAMKADPDKVKVGQVIGKALQDYSGDTIGKITVLVSIK